MADLSTQKGPEPPPVENASISLAERIKEAKKASRLLSLGAGTIALIAIAAGITGRGTLALWCLPVFLVLGVAANATNQKARRLTAPATSPSAARQVGEGILLAVLALFFVALLFVMWFWFLMGQGRG